MNCKQVFSSLPFWLFRCLPRFVPCRPPKLRRQLFIRPVQRGTNTTRGAELAATQIGLGADVALQLAVSTGIGILQITADAGKLGVVSDVNQNGLHS